jgi:ATP-dependent Clp protease ATP-binding subunit ClpC
MFERFTERARRVVVHAQEEARELNHNYIGTEHLLLGLMREPESIAARALRELEISQEAAREQVIQIVGRGKKEPSGHIPFTPRAKKVLELSLREALQLGHNYIGTEHILLGLVREGDGVAAQVLISLGGTLSRVRDKVLELAPAGTGEPMEPGAENIELSAQLRRVAPGGVLDVFARRLRSIDERLATIERHLGIERESGGPARGKSGGPAGGESGGPAGGESGGPAGGESGGPAGGESEPAAGE